MTEILSKTLAKQLSMPQGILGNVILKALNKKNETIINDTIELLKLKPGDQFLDIGFGGGLSFDMMQEKHPGVKLYGLEISEKAMKCAKYNHKAAIKSGQLELKLGSVHRIPYPDQSFDHIISVNTVYFWQELENAFAEIRRVLKPGGTFILSLREKDSLKKIKATKHGFLFYKTEDLIDTLETTGFSVILHKKKDYIPFLCLENEKAKSLN